MDPKLQQARYEASGWVSVGVDHGHRSFRGQRDQKLVDADGPRVGRALSERQ